MTSTAASFDGSDGAKPPSSPWPTEKPPSWRMPLRAWKTSAPARNASAKVAAADRGDHELLEVRGVHGVLAAVEDVEERDRQDPRARPAEVAVERQVVRRRGRVGAGEARRRGSRWRPSLPLLGVPSSSMSAASIAGLVGGVGAQSAGAIISRTFSTALQDALAAEAGLVAVAQLDRLVGAGRGARGDGRPADRAVGEDDVDLDRSGCRASRGSRGRRCSSISVFTRRLRRPGGRIGGRG